MRLLSVGTGLLLVNGLAGCGGGGSAESGPFFDDDQFSATLVVPVQPEIAIALQRASFNQLQRRMVGDTACPQVPAGYSALHAVEIEFIDADGNSLATTDGSAVITDSCGFVSAPLPAGATRIRAQSAGNRDLVASISAIAASGGVASTIPENAEYRVGFLSSNTDNTLGFTISDSVTNKAVVGLSTDSFTVELDATTTAFASVKTGLSGNDASIVLVTDASGSMLGTAFTDPDTAIRYLKMNVSAIAAHQFLDHKGVNDEVAVIIFDSDTNFMDQETINTLFDFKDTSGVDANYAFPASGFTTDAAALRMIVDAYNRDTKLYGDAARFDLHPDTVALQIDGSWPWGSSTAFYSSAVLASEKLAARSNPSRFIVAMTDGRNNRGLRDLDEVIRTANENRTPVYTIGFEIGDEDNLKRLANETGATYFQANSLQISDAYNSIQTNILFQYVGSLSEMLDGVTSIVLNFDVDGDGVPEATRTITQSTE